MTLLVLLAAALSAGPAEPLEIQASLRGTFLFPPLGRCCSFSLHLDRNGVLTVELQTDAGREVVSRVVPQETVDDLRVAVRGVKFFSLSQDALPVTGVDVDVRSISVTLGDRTRQIETRLCPLTDRWRAHLQPSELDATERACALWTAIRALVTDKRAEVF